jgi:hypothetical protein
MATGETFSCLGLRPELVTAVEAPDAPYKHWKAEGEDGDGSGSDGAPGANKGVCVCVCVCFS